MRRVSKRFNEPKYFSRMLILLGGWGKRLKFSCGLNSHYAPNSIFTNSRLKYLRDSYCSQQNLMNFYIYINLNFRNAIYYYK